MKEHIRQQYKFTMELVPPGCHRRNAAEVAIRNFKAHFLSILAGTADNFPPSLWDRLLPQTEITLNLLRQSNATPTVSAYAHLSGPFDYNKMPLAPMGCEVQVHEKTDKRGSWAYHSVDGWYLNTSPEHYRVHNCFIKDTKSERLTDTIQFKHKNITNPSITPADKIMHALADCKTALQGLINHKSTQEYQELHQLIRQSEQHLMQQQNNKTNPPTMTPTTVPRVQDAAQVPRVQEDGRVPRVHKPTPTPQPIRIARSRRARLIPSTPTINLPNQPPALSTRSRTAATNLHQAPPAANTRNKRISHLRQPTDFSKLRTKGQALAVQLQSTTGRQQFMQQYQQLEQEVHEAMAVLDKESGKLLNYRQLLQHPKYKADWSVSSANEFGRLAQGVGGRIKNPTDTIRFIYESDIPKTRKKDVTYGSFLCTVRPEKAEPNRTRFTVGGDKINYRQEKWPHQQPKC
jgi:hypothetical protein